MGYSRTWSTAYVAESIKRMERQFRADADYLWTKMAVSECGQVAKAAEQIGEALGDTKLASIAQSVVATGTGNNRYKRITDKQAHALTVALLEKHGSARGIAFAVWGVTDANIEGADA